MILAGQASEGQYVRLEPDGPAWLVRRLSERAAHLTRVSDGVPITVLVTLDAPVYPLSGDQKEA